MSKRNRKADREKRNLKQTGNSKGWKKQQEVKRWLNIGMS